MPPKPISRSSTHSSASSIFPTPSMFRTMRILICRIQCLCPLCCSSASMLIMYNCITWLHPNIYARSPFNHSYGTFSILPVVVVDSSHAVYVPYSLLGAEIVGKEFPNITMLGTCLRMKPRVRCSGRGTP